MSNAVGQNIGNHLVKFLEYDDKNNSSYWRSFMRIRVMLEVQKYLKKSTEIKNPEGE